MLRIYLCLILMACSACAAGTTSFTYQGQLKDGETPLNGNFDFSFKLFDAPSGGAEAAPAQSKSGIVLTNGLFTVELDFGAAAFDGLDRWLEISYAPAGGALTVLSPRQKITQSPYALRAATINDVSVTTSKLADGAVTDAKIVSLAGGKVIGAVSNATSATSFTGSLAGDVTGTQGATVVGKLKGIPVSATAPSNGQALRFNNTTGEWEPTGVTNGTVTSVAASGPLSVTNGTTTPVVALTGTVPDSNLSTNVTLLSGRAGGQTLRGGTAASESLTIDSTAHATKGNITLAPSGGAVGIGGAPTAGASLDVINGSIRTDTSVITPVVSASGTTMDLMVGGQRTYRITTGFGNRVSIVGGHPSNSISDEASIICGGGSAGKPNVIDSYYCFIGGGTGNLISVNNYQSVIAGGSSNQCNGVLSTIGGGEGNTTQQYSATVAGGRFNNAAGIYTTISGGYSNIASGLYSTIPGGFANTASGDYSFAAGSKSQATHQGAMVLADSLGFNFASTANNQFSLRAAGGVRLVTAVDGSGAAIKTFSIASTGDVNVSGDLDVAGVMTIGNRPAATGQESLKIIRGSVNSGGTIFVGSGFSVTKNGTGDYTITFAASSFSGVPSNVVTPSSVSAIVANTAALAQGSFQVLLKTTAGAAIDTSFSFISIGPP